MPTMTTSKASPEAGGIAQLPCDAFQEIVITLVWGLLHSGFFADHCDNALSAGHADYGIEFVSAIEVGFDQNQLIRRELAQFGLNLFGCAALAPSGRNRFQGFIVDDDRPGDVITQAAVLLVAHHANEADSVHSGENINRAHEIAADALNSGHRPSRLM